MSAITPWALPLYYRRTNSMRRQWCLSSTVSSDETKLRALSYDLLPELTGRETLILRK